MPRISRRKFVSLLGVSSAIGILGGVRVPGRQPSRRWDGDLHLLVVGDSLIAGQGLREEDRFYSLTRDWLRDEVVRDSGRVFMKNLSHSGSNVYLNEDEKAALQEAEKAIDEFYHPEVNFSFPSISTQVEVARREYEAEGVTPEDVDLIMVTGGITNISVKGIINPFQGEKELRRDIVRYCNGYMGRLLSEMAGSFPNALIAVIGYYPMISPKSSTGMIYNAVLELYGFPGPFKPVMNNLLTKQFFKILHSKMTKRSRIWSEGSDRELSAVVDEHNRRTGREMAVFVKSPIDESTWFGTRNSLLWKMGKKGRSEDDLYDIRVKACDAAIESVNDVDLTFKRRFCELSGLGHPNPEGSRAYAEAIKKGLESTLLKAPKARASVR